MKQQEFKDGYYRTRDNEVFYKIAGDTALLVYLCAHRTAVQYFADMVPITQCIYNKLQACESEIFNKMFNNAVAILTTKKIEQ